MSADPRRLLAAGLLAGVAVVVAVGPPRPRPAARPVLVAVPDVDDVDEELEAADCSDVLDAHTDCICCRLGAESGPPAADYIHDLAERELSQGGAPA